MLIYGIHPVLEALRAGRVSFNPGRPQDLSDQVGLLGPAAGLGAQRICDGVELFSLLGL